eukprot:m.10667 g.10667  ORF g.10667 m.10667 type:complete len:383 (+) comp8432_c0_seq1:81-1229(+)
MNSKLLHVVVVGLLSGIALPCSAVLCDPKSCAEVVKGPGGISRVVPLTTKVTSATHDVKATNSDLRVDTNSSWTTLNAPGLCYRDLAVVSESVMFAVAENGFVVATTDGKNWKIILTAGEDYYWYGVHATDENNVMIGGFQDSAGASLGIIRTTQDGGKTWTKDIVIDSSAWLTGTIQYATEKDGMLLASLSGRAHYTNDGGNTWVAKQVTPDQGWLANQFWIQNGTIRLSGTHDCVNQGMTYNFTCKNPVNMDGDGPTYFTDDNIGYVGAGFISPQVTGFLYRSSDGGATWGNSILNTPWPVRTLAFNTDGSKGYVGGGNFFTSVGGVYASEDGGKTWTLDVTTGMEHQAIRTLAGADGKTTTAVTVGCARSGGKIMTRTF